MHGPVMQEQGRKKKDARWAPSPIAVVAPGLLSRCTGFLWCDFRFAVLRKVIVERFRDNAVQRAAGLDRQDLQLVPYLLRKVDGDRTGLHGLLSRLGRRPLSRGR